MLLDNRPKRLDPCTSSVISVSFGQSFWSVMVFCTICGKEIHGANVWNCQHPDGRAHHKFHHWCRDNAISGLGIVWYVWWCFDMFGGFWCFSFKKNVFFLDCLHFFWLIWLIWLILVVFDVFVWLVWFDWFVWFVCLFVEIHVCIYLCWFCWCCYFCFLLHVFSICYEYLWILWISNILFFLC